MTVNLIKLAVGVESVEHLKDIQRHRLDLEKKGGDVSPRLRHITRNMPRRFSELLNGGSIYWVIRRVIKARQKIIDLEETRRKDGKVACAIILDQNIIETVPRSFRPFQGWRYFSKNDAPQDLNSKTVTETEMPLQMQQDMKNLGLL